jgi:hypothetical protein
VDPYNTVLISFRNPLKFLFIGFYKQRPALTDSKIKPPATIAGGKENTLNPNSYSGINYILASI